MDKNTEKDRQFECILNQAGNLLKQGRTVIIAIDGRCGSGKSTLAGKIAQTYDCNVIHMDDFYLPFEKRRECWWEFPGGNMDFERLRTEVTEPMTAQKEIIYRPYDCMNETFRRQEILPRKNLYVIEGSYSHHPELQMQYDLKVFLTCGKEEQKRRLMDRNPERYESFVTRWIPMEERYYQAFGIESAEGTIVVKTDQ